MTSFTAPEGNERVMTFDVNANHEPSTWAAFWRLRTSRRAIATLPWTPRNPTIPTKAT